MLGGGLVYPELNFTLPPMLVDAPTMPEVRRQYRQIISGRPAARAPNSRRPAW